MLEDMRAENDVEAAVGQIESGDVELSIRLARHGVGTQILTRDRLNQPAQSGLGGKVQDAMALDLPAIESEPERHETMPLEATALRAARIEARWHAVRAEVPPIAAERTFAREPAAEPIENAHEIVPLGKPSHCAGPGLFRAPSAPSG